MKTSIRIMALTSTLALGLSAVACGDDTDDDGIGGAGADSSGGRDSGGSNAGGAGGTGGTGGASGGTGGFAAGGEGGAPVVLPTLLEIVGDDDDYSIFLEALDKADLADALEDDDVTVFVPTNAAFTALLADLDLGTLDDLSAAQLRPILRYHVVDAVIEAAAAALLAPGPAKVTSRGGTFGLSTDEGDLFVDAAMVVDADVRGENGIVHVIDAVMLPSISDMVTTEPLLAELHDVAVDADDGSGAPKLLSTLDGTSPLGGWLLLAPSNEAVIAASPLPTGQALTNVLLYHAVPLANPPTALVALTYVEESLPTAYYTHSVIVDGGSFVTVRDEDGVSADATVTLADLYADNGIVHVVSSVLLPD